MKKVFLDTSYWIALINRKDPFHVQVIQKLKSLKSVHRLRFITTDEVLMELLTFFSSPGSNMRLGTAEMVYDILNDPSIEVIP